MTNPLLQRVIKTPAPPEHPRRREASDKPTPPPESQASPVALVMLAAAAVAGELAVRTSPATVAGGLAVVACSMVVLASSNRRRPEVVLPVAIALLLAGNLVLRASPWVVVPTVLAIAALLIVAAQDRLLSSSRFLGLLVTVVWIESLLKVPGWAAGRLLQQLTGERRNLAPIVRGLVAATAIGGLLLLLLASGDAVFGSILGEAIGGSLWSHGAVGLLCFVLFSTLGVSSSVERPLPRIDLARPEAKIEGFMGLVTMAAVLGVWCATQVVVALGGADRLLATEGLTRAEYARTGFFQLVAVAAAVIAILSLLDRTTPRTTPTSKRLFASLSTLITAQTVVLVWVTFARLSLYIDAFGLTMLRLSVACFLGWLGAVLILVTLRVVGVGGGRRWTPMTSFLLAAVVTLGFGWANPEVVVANTNLGRSTATALDTEYLARLSADAEPTVINALDKLDPVQADELRLRLCDKEQTPRSYGPLGWNRAENRASLARLQLRCR